MMGSILLEYPVLRMRFCQASVCSSRSLFNFLKDAEVANCCQLSSGLPVGWFIEIMTNLPFTLGSQLANVVESITSGMITIPALIDFPFVDGLQAN